MITEQFEKRRVKKIGCLSILVLTLVLALPASRAGAATTLYRSVGTTATDLNTNNRTLTISGSTATFSDTMPDNVGVGDALCYNDAASDITYYFNGYSAGEAWDSYGSDPSAMTDGSTATNAFAWDDGDTQLLNSNDCPGTDLGTITKVEIRLHGGVCDGDSDSGGANNDTIYLRPAFALGDGDNHEVDDLPFCGSTCAPDNMVCCSGCCSGGVVVVL